MPTERRRHRGGQLTGDGLRPGGAARPSLGHRVGDCPKLHSDTREKQRKNKDYFGADGYGAEM